MAFFDGLFTGVSNILAQGIASDASQRNTDRTNSANKDIAQMNIDYQNAYNEKIFNREDTAIQRSVADSRAAGVSPLAKVTGAGSGGTASAPQSNQVVQANNFDYSSALGQVANSLASMVKTSRENDILKAQKERMDLENQKIAMDNSFFKRVMDSRVNKENSDWNYTKYSGVNKDMNDFERIVYGLGAGLGSPLHTVNPDGSISYSNDGFIPLLETAGKIIKDSAVSAGDSYEKFKKTDVGKKVDNAVNTVKSAVDTGANILSMPARGVEYLYNKGKSWFNDKSQEYAEKKAQKQADDAKKSRDKQAETTSKKSLQREKERDIEKVRNGTMSRVDFAKKWR